MRPSPTAADSLWAIQHSCRCSRRDRGGGEAAGANAAVPVPEPGTLALLAGAGGSALYDAKAVQPRPAAGWQGAFDDNECPAAKSYPFTDRLVLQYTILRERWCHVNRRCGERDSKLGPCRDDRWAIVWPNPMFYGGIARSDGAAWP